MIPLSFAVQSLRPGAEFVMVENDVEGIIWHTEGVEPLTQAEVDAEMARLEQAAADKAAADAAARDTALAKLAALGLTVDDLTALGL